MFGEFARRDEGVLANLKFWPRQWATARMFANTAKGFHVHPPFIPEGEDAAKWLRRQFAKKILANYEAEQWDVMFFVQGRVEMILRDVREGFRSRVCQLSRRCRDPAAESGGGGGTSGDPEMVRRVPADLQLPP